jgi:cyclopropane fatty-acyl-phospholipid synthase-like methyltransferase
MISNLDRKPVSRSDADRISRYFDETARFYHRFWHGPTAALHFGMRASGHGHHQELTRTNEVLADLVQVGPHDRVLDAGCGVGGSAIWLANVRGARAVGITLSRMQVATARRNAAAARCTDRVEFHVADYHRTEFLDGAFDVVWALESSCYSSNKHSFLSEAYRLLRPGGRIVVADGFCNRAPRSAEERRSYETFKAGLVLPEFCSSEAFVEEMRRVGFQGIEAKSHSGDVSGSIERLYWRCWITFPAALIARRFGLVSDELIANSRSGLEARSLLRRGVMDYVVMTAFKGVSGETAAGDVSR